MNRECKGDWLPTLGRYRCCGDGHWVKADTLPETCPNCERTVSATTRLHPVTRQLLVTEVFIDPWGWIEMEHIEHKKAA